MTARAVDDTYLQMTSPQPPDQIKKNRNVSHNTLYQKVSEYDQEIPQSHTADQPAVPNLHKRFHFAKQDGSQRCR